MDEKTPKDKAEHRLTKKQEQVLSAYENSLGNVSAAVKASNIHRSTFYAWKKENPLFAEEVEAVDESMLDFAETMLKKNIREGKESSIFFFLKTKGKKRGYIETQENIISANPFEECMKRVALRKVDDAATQENE